MHPAFSDLVESIKGLPDTVHELKVGIKGRPFYFKYMRSLKGEHVYFRAEGRLWHFMMGNTVHIPDHVFDDKSLDAFIEAVASGSAYSNGPSECLVAMVEMFSRRLNERRAAFRKMCQGLDAI